MRLLCEIFVIGALIYLGWERPFREWLPNSKPIVAAPAPASAPVVRYIARPAPTPSGQWMWDPNHRSALDRPAYDSRERYTDAQGRKYWYDANGVRHYDP